MLPLDRIVPVAVMLVGAIFGSFANVVIWRFPRGESVSFPPSHCTACGSDIAWYDNIPVVSWIVLRGKCRRCSASIAVRYPVVELLTAVLWLLAWIRFGTTARFGFAAVFFYLLLILSFIDIDTMRLPNTLVGIAAGFGVAGIAVSLVSGLDVVPLITGTGVFSNPAVFAAVGLLLGALVPLGISMLYHLIRGAQGIGMGDVKLLAVIGLFLGPYVLLALFVGSVVGAVFSLIFGAGRRLTRKVPFGPFLAVGAVTTALVGERVVGWYLSVL